MRWLKAIIATGTVAVLVVSSPLSLAPAERPAEIVSVSAEPSVMPIVESSITPIAPIIAPRETNVAPVSRSGGERYLMEVSAYTLAECDKPPESPRYGYTSSNVKAAVGVTVASGPEIPLGSQVTIEHPYFDTWPNKGNFIVQDRGGAVDCGELDVYFGDPYLEGTLPIERAMEFGRQYVWVTVEVQ